MALTRKERQDLRDLVASWKAKSNEYLKSALEESDKLTRARYEGECYVYKWCQEDLQSWLNTH